MSTSERDYAESQKVRESYRVLSKRDRDKVSECV